MRRRILRRDLLPGDRFIELALDKERHVLDVLFMHAAEAVTIQDQAGQIIYANDRAAELVGLRSRDQMLSRQAGTIVSRFDLIDAAGDPIDSDQLPGRRVLRGEPVAEGMVGYREREKGDVRWSRIRASPVKDDSGRVVWAINFFRDVTEEVLSERERELISRTNEALGASLQIEEILVRLAGVIVPDLGYWSGVHLIDDGGYLSPVTSAHPGSADGEIIVTETDQARFHLDTAGLQARVARTGKAEYVDFGENDREESELPVFSEAIDRYDLEHVACLPLRAADRVVGTLTVGRKGAAGFSSNERGWLEAVGERAGVALANALLYAHEHETAEILQRGLVPTELPHLAGVQIASRYRPQARISGVGGDFFDVLVLGDGSYAVAVGDIEGKGIPAAAAVGVARHTLRATAALDPTPATVIGRMNQTLGEEQPRRMCTLAYLVCRPRLQGGADMRVALAGHPPPVVVRAEGQIFPVGEPCPPLGFLEHLDPVEHPVDLGPGDTVIVYTDGFSIEGHAPPESIMPLLEGAHGEELESLLDRLLARLNTAHPHPRDDVVLLALRL